MMFLARLLIFIFVGKLLLETLDPHEILLILLWLWSFASIGYHSAIRKNGWDMMRTGRKRFLGAHW